MPKLRWPEAQVAWFYANPGGAYEQFCDAFPDGPRRTYNAWRVKKGDLELGHDGSPTPRIVADTAKEPEVNWREWNDPIRTFQTLRRKAKGHSDEHAIAIEAADPVAFVVLGDTHIGAWSSDHDLFERITDEILAIPGLYIALLGDLAHMAIKLRNVTEVGDNLLPADIQLLYLQSWLLEIQDRVLFATWGNHEVERAEAQAGLNPFGDLYRKVARHYFNGIGHLTLRINDIDYEIAASHHFRGRSIYSPVHGCQRYLVLEGIDRDIAIAGDSHVPGVMKFTHGRETKLAVNCGSSHSFSGYAARYFSLYTHPVFPVVVLDHEVKNFHAHWNLHEYLRHRGSDIPIPVIE
jgi:hypothetical protein